MVQKRSAPERASKTPQEGGPVAHLRAGDKGSLEVTGCAGSRGSTQSWRCEKRLASMISAINAAPVAAAISIAFAGSSLT